MNVLIFTGSPRAKGNTETLVSKVVTGIEKTGGVCEKIRLADLDIHPCIGCGGCEKEGNCVLQDDMQKMYPKIANADRIIIATPIYFYGVTAQTKAFIDRCQALWSRKYLLKMRLEGATPKIGYFISVAATKGERIFAGALLTVKYGFDAMDFSYGGELVVRGADRRGAVSEMHDELERAEEFGKLVVQS